jgi:multiple sugar transport system permease protein
MTTVEPRTPTLTEGLEAAQPTTGGRGRRRRVAVLAGLFLFVTCLMMLSPFIWTAMSVTKPTNVAFVNPPVFIYQPTLQAFVDLWQTTYFYQYLINTLIVAVISTIIALLIGLPAAYALARTGWYISAHCLDSQLYCRCMRSVNG